jgi:hypothetical protein
LESIRSDRIYSRTLNKLQVSQGSEVQAEILQCIRCLVDEKNIEYLSVGSDERLERLRLTEHDIKSVHLNISLAIYQIRESCSLKYG